jgi:predicted nucleic acid-binding protein
MIVVADTTPLNYLIQIDEIDLLPAIFGKVLVPQAVFLELQHPKTAAKVRQWMTHHPDWLELCSVISTTPPALMSLDLGEREAILLALERNVETVLMDETPGRKCSEAFHLEVRGTLGILERGARLGLCSFGPALHKLEQTKFRMSPALKAAFLARNF